MNPFAHSGSICSLHMMGVMKKAVKLTSTYVDRRRQLSRLKKRQWLTWTEKSTVVDVYGFASMFDDYLWIDKYENGTFHEPFQLVMKSDV